MVVIRIGCLWSGCCHGTVTDLPWATRYGVDTSPWYAHRAAGLVPQSSEWSIYAHPLQLYFLVAIVATGACLLWFRKRQSYDGQLMLVFMVLNGVSKGALESLRFSYVPSLQVYSLFMAAVGLVGLLVMQWRRGSASV
jgi:phosphatidylglycerol:prolipoprotein diacylglycerol transferase